MSVDLSLVGETPYVVSAEDLEAITTDVWTAYLPDEHGPVYPAPVAEGALDDLVHASVGVHGAWTGQVVVELSPVGADRVARSMLALEPDAPVGGADVSDAVGELANVVGGNVKSLMPAPSSLGLPVVVQGRVSRFAAYDAVEVCSLELGWAGEPVRVSVWGLAPKEEK